MYGQAAVSQVLQGARPEVRGQRPEVRLTTDPRILYSERLVLRVLEVSVLPVLFSKPYRADATTLASPRCQYLGFSIIMANFIWS
jgi:hypothetical protein